VNQKQYTVSDGIREMQLGKAQFKLPSGWLSIFPFLVFGCSMAYLSLEIIRYHLPD